MLSCDEKIFEGIAVYLIPKIGSSVVTLILSASIILNDKHTNALLAQVPNVRISNYLCFLIRKSDIAQLFIKFSRFYAFDIPFLSKFNFHNYDIYSE